MVAPGEIFGGAERQILTLLNHLGRASVVPSLFVFQDGELARRARIHGIPTVVIGAGRGLDLAALVKLSVALRSGHFDVVHVHGYKAITYVAVSHVFREFPIIKTEHGGMELGGVSPSARLKLRFYRAVENFAVRRSGTWIVYVTQELQRSCCAEHQGLRTRVIPNGIDPYSVTQCSRPAELHAEHFNVAVVGRLERVKGVRFAIEMVADKRACAKIRLNIVGDGPLRQELEELARRLNVTQRVQFLGFRTDATAFIAHADALLMPSLHEGLPYTLLEAIAAGTPVVASRIGGLAEILDHESTALLFSPGNVQQIAACMERFLAEPQFARRLAALAQDRLMPRFTAEKMVECYVKLYRDAVAEGNGA